MDYEDFLFSADKNLDSRVEPMIVSMFPSAFLRQIDIPN